MVLRAGEHQSGSRVGHPDDDQREDACLGHVLLALGLLLGGGAHGVVAEDREEHRRFPGHHRAESSGHDQVVVPGADLEGAQGR